MSQPELVAALRRLYKYFPSIFIRDAAAEIERSEAERAALLARAEKAEAELAQWVASMDEMRAQLDAVLARLLPEEEDVVSATLTRGGDSQGEEERG